MVEEEEECFLPGAVSLPEKIVMLSAGDSHTAALSQSGQVTVTVSLTSHLSSDGQLWTMGNSEQGQLGRISEKFAYRGGRRGLAALLKPGQVRLNFRSKLGDFTDVWAGSYNTVALTEGNKLVVMGLNNYSQMALPVSKGLSFFMPQHSKDLTALSCQQVALGESCSD